MNDVEQVLLQAHIEKHMKEIRKPFKRDVELTLIIRDSVAEEASLYVSTEQTLEAPINLLKRYQEKLENAKNESTNH